MNRAILCGRTTKEPVISATGNTTVAKFTLAVDRRFKDADGNYQTDFINCVCFGKSAEFAEKYVKKGIKMLVTGRIQTGSYTNKDGQKVYTTDVAIEEQEFAESKGAGTTETKSSDSDFMDIPQSQIDDMPF